MAEKGKVKVHSRRAEDFKSIYASGANFSSTADDVRLIFYTFEMGPVEQRTEGPSIGEFKLDTQVQVNVLWNPEVIMSHSLFERFADMIATQREKLREQRSKEETDA